MGAATAAAGERTIVKLRRFSFGLARQTDRHANNLDLTNHIPAFVQPSKGNSMVSPNYAGFSTEFDYSLDYSALLGAQVNLQRFKHSAFGPWERVPAVILFPSPLRSPSENAPGISTVALKHLIAYIRGATGVQ